MKVLGKFRTSLTKGNTELLYIFLKHIHSQVRSSISLCQTSCLAFVVELPQLTVCTTISFSDKQKWVSAISMDGSV